MCLILFAYNSHPRYKLVVAANRDEFYQRPTLTADYWRDHPDILAGRDLKAGGTWMGITTSGRFAALTNYRDPSSYRPEAKSRGHIVQNYLSSNVIPEVYIENLVSGGAGYNGFNLLLGNKESLYYYSNREKIMYKIPPGVHGLSNGMLNEPWPKISQGVMVLSETLQDENIQAETLFAIMADRRQPDDTELPQTGVGLEMERMLAPAFVMSPAYGTRLTTVLLVDHKYHVKFWEHSFKNGHPDIWDEVYYEFRAR